MLNDLELVMTEFAVDEDAAFVILELCGMLDREDEVARHGYPKDTPRGRELAVRLTDPEFRTRLRELAEAEELPAELIAAI